MILLIILQISEIYQSFMFSVQCLVLLITCKHYLMEILCYLTSPWTNPWKYVSKCFDKKRVSLVCIDRRKSDTAAFLELNPGISVTHRHPANRKTGLPLSLQVRLIHEIGPSGPRTILITVDIHVGADILLAISNVSQHSKRRKISRYFGGHFGWRHRVHKNVTQTLKAKETLTKIR